MRWIRTLGLSGLAMMALGLSLVGTAAAQGADKFQDILSKGVVRIGVPVDAPPFGSVNQQRQPEGFDIELAEMVAKALGAKLEMTQVTGANRIPYLLSDRVDIIISVMGLTPERAKQIMFTAPYANTFLAVFGPKSANVPSAGDLGSMRIVAAKGTTQELAVPT
ncbi:MAG: transporter substrate-binding domain-containing protein [Microvirga sp.]